MIVNLGCGTRPIENAINLDKTKHHDYVDVVHDLNLRPWPFDSSSADELYAIDVLEHLHDFVESLEECHRVLKVGGVLFLQVPYWGNPLSHRDPTHRWFFTPDSLDYFIIGTTLEKSYGFYSPMRWNKQFFGWSPGGENIDWRLEKCPPKE